MLSLADTPGHLSVSRERFQRFQPGLRKGEGVKLSGRVAIITGGAGSMGSEIAQLFAAEGAGVVVSDIRSDEAQVVVQQIVESGGQALAAALDVRDSGRWAEVVSEAEGVFGHVDTLCNIAGANFRVSFDEQTEEMWQRIMETNLTAYFLGIKAVVPAMRRVGRGVILNTGSLGSLRQGAGGPAYGVSKAGLVGLTKGTAASYAADNIRCVLINPGHVDSNFIRNDAEYSPNDWSTSIDNPENYQSRLTSTPLGRLCTPRDVANTFLFAASDDASMITGSAITVDGGAGI